MTPSNLISAEQRHSFILQAHCKICFADSFGGCFKLIKIIYDDSGYY